MGEQRISYKIWESWNVQFRSTEGEAESRNHHVRQQRFLTESQAKRFLDSDPAAAEHYARDILQSDPLDPQALFLWGAVLRRNGRIEEAKSILESLVLRQPYLKAAWLELGLAFIKLRKREPAEAALRRAVDLDWMNSIAWYALVDVLMFPKDRDAAFSTPGPWLKDAGAALRESRPDQAEAILRGALRGNPRDVQAMKFLADMLLRSGRLAESASLLEQCFGLAPDFAAARFRYVTLLFTTRQFERALPEIDQLLAIEPGEVLYRALKALALAGSSKRDEAISQFESFIDGCTLLPGLSLQYARVLRAARSEKAVQVYRRLFETFPSFVEAYESLAHSKSLRIDESTIEVVRAALQGDALAQESRARLHFVMGRGCEDVGRYGEAFENFRACKTILSGTHDWDIEEGNNYLRRAKAVFTADFFGARRNTGTGESGAIFIVGMPRSGSTLVEQILSSHSQVEGLGEIENLSQAIARTAPEVPGDPIRMQPYSLRNLEHERFREMGEAYMASARSNLRSGRHFFTDKTPQNYVHAGIIHLSLPNARIIDVRRHPLDCCVSCFKHYFPEGQPLRLFPGDFPLSLDLLEMGQTYANYVELMARFDQVLPGKIHRVIYENLIDNFEEEVRRLLRFVGLPFEEACLEFHDNQRFVTTLSADQVRMPLYRSAIGHWQRYEPWLQPLRDKLGNVIDCYPDVPQVFS